MIYIAVQLIQIFSEYGSIHGSRVTGHGGTRGPRGPKKGISFPNHVEAFQRTVLEMLKVSLIYWPGLCWPRGPAKALLTMVRLVSADQEALLAHLFQTPKATTALLFLFANCHLLYSFLSAHRCRQGGKVGPKFHLLAGGEGQQTPLKTSCWFHIYGAALCVGILIIIVGWTGLHNYHLVAWHNFEYPSLPYPKLRKPYLS